MSCLCLTWTPVMRSQQVSTATQGASVAWQRGSCIPPHSQQRCQQFRRNQERGVFNRLLQRCPQTQVQPQEQQRPRHSTLISQSLAAWPAGPAGRFVACRAVHIRQQLAACRSWCSCTPAGARMLLLRRGWFCQRQVGPCLRVMPLSSGAGDPRIYMHSVNAMCLQQVHTAAVWLMQEWGVRQLPCLMVITIIMAG